MNWDTFYFAGLDIHKKTIAYCIKRQDGKIMAEDTLNSNRKSLRAWMDAWEMPCVVGMEATMFTGWIYDLFLQHGVPVKVGHPLRLKAIVAGKKKSDKLDARVMADLLRCNLFPEAYMAPQRLRHMRQVLRFRNLLVRSMVKMKNKTAGLLMEHGVEYNKKKLHGKKYFEELLRDIQPDIPASMFTLLGLSRKTMLHLQEQQQWLLEQLSQAPELNERVERLRTIPGVGEVTALTWALEIGEAQRFPSVKECVSYCGLCSALRESAGVSKRNPISKQRNEHLQTVLIEAAKLAPRWNKQLAAFHQRELERGANRNQATLAVARKLVAYLMYVDKSGNNFEERISA